MTFLARSLLIALLACGVFAAAASAHEFLDHPAPPPGSGSAPPETVAEGGVTGAKWEFVGSVATGNPHSDLDFFTSGKHTYASVGTLAVGPNGGGQSIIQLTNDKGEVAPDYVGMAPTAFCPAATSSVTGLQHDVEATPKGRIDVLNTFNPQADRRDAQLLLDATDATGRCHDQGTFGLPQTPAGQPDAPPQGGLEIIDVTDPKNPQTIGMTSHIGQAHTVNVDPRRPHIAYAVTSDTVSVSNNKRENEIATDADRFDLDGFEIVDLRSCMNFPASTSLADKRKACRPTVYRYRWETLEQAMGHTTKDFVFGCHELELYPDDRLTCADGAALQVFDMSGAFDDRGTPADFRDDVPRGAPLPCSLRDSSSKGIFQLPKEVQVVDCVTGGPNRNVSLDVANWLKIGKPSLQGVRHLGSVFHEGGHPGTTTDPENQTVTRADEDVKFNHESELSASGKLLIGTDERGGGVTPPGASCSQAADNPYGNGGVHFYRTDQLRPAVPTGANAAAEAYKAYARLPDNKKAIFRAKVRTGAQATVCTAHVFQQIPGQNRIFMAWYSQGTQVIDFVERADGRVELKETGYWLPVNNNEWVSHIFKAQENPNGTFTYFGATGDFNLGERGRNAVDVYKVTLPPPPKPAGGPGLFGGKKTVPVRDPKTGKISNVAVGPQAGAPACVASASFRRVAAGNRGRGRLGISFAARAAVTIDVFQQSHGRRLVGEKRVAQFRNRRRSFTWSGRDKRGRRVQDGYYIVRFRSPTANGPTDVRRLALRRRGGRWRVVQPYHRRESCGLVRWFKLERPVFGGRTNHALHFSFYLGRSARVAATVTGPGGRVYKRFRTVTRAGRRLHRLRMGVKNSTRRGLYKVTLRVRSGGTVVVRRLYSRRI
jgi:hypothetical protein